MAAPIEVSPTNEPVAKPFHLPVLLAVWGSFLLYSAVAAPVPAVNEPHYLCKAKHFWQPAWCANDFFLESTNAHTVFYSTVGALTNWFTLEQTAWAGRITALLILAVGWCACLGSFSNCPWFPLHVAWLFLALAACGNFSGEWLVGGVEGKVFSYGLLFAAVARLYTHRIVSAGALAGLAVAFHPVIGVWGLLSVAGAWLVEHRLWRVRSWGRATTGCGGIITKVSGLAALVMCSLPGLVPVFLLLAEPVAAQTKFSANFIQVYYRLAHHLDPMRFLPRAYVCYALLLALWGILILRCRRSDSQRRFDLLVAAAVLFAVAGIIIGWGPRPAQLMTWYAQRAALLKFYPFRLADVLVPLAVAAAVANWLQGQTRRTAHRWVRLALVTLACWYVVFHPQATPDKPESEIPSVAIRIGLTLLLILFELGVVRWLQWGRPQFSLALSYGMLFTLGLFVAHDNVEVSRYSGNLRADWIDACDWIDRNLPADALVNAPHNGWAFKWFGQRAEYVSFKDCPQNAEGIVEWNRRLNFLKRWFDEHYDDEFYSNVELRDLRAKTGITHIFTDRLGPLELEPIFKNGSFQVYDLTSLD